MWHLDQIEEAHHTSAKYDESISEFDQTQLRIIYKNNFYAPFVKDSPFARDVDTGMNTSLKKMDVYSLLLP